MTKKEYMDAYVAKYKSIIGRNNYSQPKRTYCFKKYSDGKYYSDCSSSQALTFKEIGLPISYNGSTCPSTVGMYHSKDLIDVPVIIKNGIIQNPEVLQVGDLLLFAGTDTSRASSGYVGHVEAVYKINASGTVTICGHGGTHPRTTEMNAYCKSRYNQKTSTKVKNKGLIKVRRHKKLSDGYTEEPAKPVVSEPTTKQEWSVDDVKVTVTGRTVNIRKAPTTEADVVKVAQKGDTFYTIEKIDGWVPISVDGYLCWISEKYIKEVK